MSSGAVAVEMGLVLLPFVALTIAIVEAAVVMLAGEVLQTATTN